MFFHSSLLKRPRVDKSQLVVFKYSYFHSDLRMKPEITNILRVVNIWLKNIFWWNIPKYKGNVELKFLISTPGNIEIGGSSWRIKEGIIKCQEYCSKLSDEIKTVEYVRIELFKMGNIGLLIKYLWTYICELNNLTCVVRLFRLFLIFT